MDAPETCDTSNYLKDTDFSGGDLLPESQKFTTPNASACCEACKNYSVDKFCAVWTWGLSGGLTRCYLKKVCSPLTLTDLLPYPPQPKPAPFFQITTTYNHFD